MSMQLISTTTLSTAAASITFSSIPGTYTDLFILISGQTTSGGDSLIVQFNSDTGSNYAWRRIYGNGSTVSTDASAASTTYVLGPALSANANPANTFANISCYISNYTLSTSKSISFDGVAENNDTASFQMINSGLYTQTTAITTVTLKTFSTNNFIANSIASLYGITKGTDGITTAT